MEIIDNNLILNFGNDTKKRAIKDSLSTVKTLY